jgi:hypothetical protein
VIHAASEEADHAHSGCVLTPTVAIAAPALTGAAGGVSVTTHFVGEGLVDVATAEPHPVATQANSHTAT